MQKLIIKRIIFEHNQTKIMKRFYPLALFYTLIAFNLNAQVHPDELVIKNRTIGKELQAHKVYKGHFNLHNDRPFGIDTIGNLQACDTVFYSWYYLTVNDAKAYISGHNDNIDSAKAEKYTGLTASQVNALWMFFGVATYTDPTLQVIHVKVWDDAGAGGTPGNILGSVDVTHASIKADVDAGNLTTVTFPTPIPIPANGNIYCGFTMDYKKKNNKLTYDTMRAVNLLNPDFFSDCNTKEQNTAWELYSKTSGQDGQWHDYVYSWGYGNRNPIFPIVQTNSCTIAIDPSSVSICKGNSIEIIASGAATYSWSPSTGLNTTEGATVIANPVTTTTYTVSGDTGSCSSIVTVTVNPTPIIYLGADTIICDTSNFVLDAGEGFNSYQWSTNETTQKIDINSTGLYSVVVKDQNGCSGTDSINITVDICTDLYEIKNNVEVNIYPNPASNYFFISIKNNLGTEIKMEVINIFGQTVLDIPTQHFQNNSEQLIDVNGLAPSIYYLKIMIGSEIIFRKIVIEK